MISKFPITPEMRVQLLHAENLFIDLRENEDVKNLTANVVEARLHIDVLHSVIKSGDLDTAKKYMADWEESQCLC
jgi:hypothetical protein